MKKLLIINKFQFGYHIDVYKWCENLRNDFSIKVITFDEGRPRITLEGVDVKYVSIKGSRIIRGIKYLLYTLLQILFSNRKVIVCCFPGCHIYKKLLPWRKMHLDIRTLTISSSDADRERDDLKIRKAAVLFDSVSAISKGVIYRLGARKNISILPLGADIVARGKKEYSKLRLLYIGTFNNRHIDNTILGFKKALESLPVDIDIHYDIIGNGVNGELEEYKLLVRELGLGNQVKIHGYIQHEKLKNFLDTCNVGVSYIPMTDYYDDQPPTKTFEYALSGLFVLATRTSANVEVITPTNGLLINDSVDDFASGVIELYNMRHDIDDAAVRSSLDNYTWSNIAKNILSPMISNL